MAKIIAKNVEFDPSDSPDVTGYKLYYEFGGIEVSYDSSFQDVGLQTTDIGLITVVGNQEGALTIGVASYDAAGNESDIFIIATDYPLDMSAPNAPSGGRIY